MVNGEQYIATTNMAGSQPYSQGGNGDAVFAWKLGGKALYTTGPRSAPVVVSGSQEAPDALPIPEHPSPGRQHRSRESCPANESGWRARTAPPPSTGDSILTASMIPSTRTVPVGHDGDVPQPGYGDVPDCAEPEGALRDAVFEGKFNFRLQPGQTAQYTFDREGEYFYNDCTDPRPVGKVLVTLAPQAAPLQIVPSVLQLKPPTGVFTSVTGVVTGDPDGSCRLDDGSGPVGLGDPTIGPIVIMTPLTTKTFNPVTAPCPRTASR
jgi:hypothetical protein